MTIYLISPILIANVEFLSRKEVVFYTKHNQRQKDQQPQPAQLQASSVVVVAVAATSSVQGEVDLERQLLRLRGGLLLS